MTTPPVNVPTEKQLAYLKNLGYTGSPPETLGEASDLISAIKAGVSSESADKAMLLERAPPLEKVRLYLTEAEDRKRSGYELAGWRLKVKRGAETSQNSIYNGAFLPFDVGRQFPELLAISGLDHTELQRRPIKGRIVSGPDQLTEITVGSRRVNRSPTTIPTKRGGCLGALVVIAVGGIGLALTW